MAPSIPPIERTGVSLPVAALLCARAHLGTAEGARTLVVVSDNRRLSQLRKDLESLLGEGLILSWPDHGLHPYQDRAPFGRLLEERGETLRSLGRPGGAVVMTTVPALAWKLPSPVDFARSLLHLKAGEASDPGEVRMHLLAMGYRIVPVCEEPGTLAPRGGLLDVFPMGADDPLRLEFDGKLLASIRVCDVFSQRTTGRVNEAEILPARERDCDDGIWHPAPESRRFDLLDHLGDRTVVVDLSGGALNDWSHGALEREEARTKALEEGRPAAACNDLWLTKTELLRRLDERPRLILSEDPGSDPATRLRVFPQERSTGGFAVFAAHLGDLRRRGIAVRWMGSPEGRALRLAELATDLPVDEVVVGTLSEGFELPDLGEAWLTDHQAMGFVPRATPTRRRGGGISLHDIDALELGDFVVHEVHGLGRYVGVERVVTSTGSFDCLVLQYRGKDQLRLPASELARLRRQEVNEEDPPKLHTLGGRTFEALKDKARAEVAVIVRELLELYAKRTTATRPPLPPDDAAQRAFDAAFPWDLTPDQARAMEDVRRDLESPVPMDRLVAGDVGFGKTEVAVRAVFKTVMDHRQVAVLAPTTLLAAQHHQVLTERFASWPLRVELLDRGTPPADRRRILSDAEAGRVDVLVGTHRLLGSDVRFADLSLLVLDEEQKFGVRQKEKLKELRTGIDVLSMSATPIPRTLHMALSGLRGISVVATPPRNRLPVETRATCWQDAEVASLLLEELERGGQAFVVAPRIDGLEFLAERVRELLPGARVEVGHGSMSANQLEKVMGTFLARGTDILVATTIVESGLDIPSVNTIVVVEAHRFGLAQLHQIRGRVGRSDLLGRCLLTWPADCTLPRKAQRRLEAMERFTELGSGWALSLRDLELRGAGNLLGEKQHGFMAAVGYHTWCRLIEEEVQRQRGESIPSPAEPRLELPGEAFLPESWISDPHLRIQLYQRLARCAQPAQTDALMEEWIDRFGPLPDPARLLLEVMGCRVRARILGITHLGITRARAILEFDPAFMPPLVELMKCPAPLGLRVEWIPVPHPPRAVADLSNAVSSIDQAMHVRQWLESLLARRVYSP